VVVRGTQAGIAGLLSVSVVVLVIASPASARIDPFNPTATSSNSTAAPAPAPVKAVAPAPAKVVTSPPTISQFLPSLKGFSVSAKLSAIQQAIAARLASAKGTSTTPPPVVVVAPPVVTPPPVLSAPPSSGILAPPTLGSGVDPTLLVPPGDTLVTRQPLISAFR
jgi:hypothetical protein